MNLLADKTYRIVLGSTLLVVLLAVFLPDALRSVSSMIAIALIAFIGIPHGATDYVLFQHLFRQEESVYSLVRFYGLYLGMMAMYGLVWLLAPTFAFVLFLSIAAYHFGQSNWYFLNNLPLWVRSIQHFLWGAFVIAAPVLWHFDSAELIIERIVRYDVHIAETAQIRIPLALLFVNVILISLYYLSYSISGKEVLRQVLNLSILSIVFYTMPLLLGFAIYFALWHAIESGDHQIQFFRRKMTPYTRSDFIQDALPYTLLSFIGVGAFLWLQNTALLSNFGWAYVFIFIAIVTLPHSVLMHLLYQKWAVSHDDIH